MLHWITGKLRINPENPEIPALIPKPKTDPQSSFLLPDLATQLDPRHALCRLAGKINWSQFEHEPVFADGQRSNLGSVAGLANYLKGIAGDAINLILAGRGHQLRMRPAGL